jgi:hypothetical protein
MAETGEWAATIDGAKLYQQRARQALPLLVRQAEAAEPIGYSALADELGMPNPRNLNYVLGAIGNTLSELRKKWGSEIPPIQCLVINKNTNLPGTGVGWFLKIPEDFGTLPRARQREIIRGELRDVYGYSRWRDVLTALELPYVRQDYSDVNRKAAAFVGGGESEDHKILKAYVANNPLLLGLPKSSPPGRPEFGLPSGDTLDVSFQYQEDWIAAEVKSARSPGEDIARGIYQCVKYLAIMRAMQTIAGKDRTARVVLVLEGTLPSKLVSLKNQLGVEVIDRVQVTSPE